jgi:hypothetical protein
MIGGRNNVITFNEKGIRVTAVTQRIANELLTISSNAPHFHDNAQDICRLAAERIENS